MTSKGKQNPVEEILADLYVAGVRARPSHRPGRSYPIGYDDLKDAFLVGWQASIDRPRMRKTRTR